MSTLYAFFKYSHVRNVMTNLPSFLSLKTFSQTNIEVINHILLFRQFYYFITNFNFKNDFLLKIYIIIKDSSDSTL